MGKIDWAYKIGSRKFWALISGVVISVMVAFGTDAGTTEKVAGVIGAVGSVAVYIYGEAKVDASREANPNNYSE